MLQAAVVEVLHAVVCYVTQSFRIGSAVYVVSVATVRVVVYVAG